MKNMYLILAVLFFFTSCNKEKEQEQENSIYGKWYLLKFEPGISPTETFIEGEIVWTFKQENKLIIELGNDVSSSPIEPTGEYKFLVNKNRISIGNREFDYSKNEDTLIISNNPSADGFRATFTKSN